MSLRLIRNSDLDVVLRSERIQKEPDINQHRVLSQLFHLLFLITCCSSSPLALRKLHIHVSFHVCNKNARSDLAAGSERKENAFCMSPTGFFINTGMWIYNTTIPLLCTELIRTIALH